jgi:hypothetical protein
LCLLALLTHIHAFWVAALLLALIDIPDFGGWLARIGGAVEKMAGLKGADGATRATSEMPADTEPDDVKPLATPAATAREAKGRSSKPKEPVHA